MENRTQDGDDILIKSISTAIMKAVLYICITIVAGMLFSTCKIDANTISECESACEKTGIQEVTSTSCECFPIDNEIGSPFVL
jgi:hypothetical protein